MPEFKVGDEVESPYFDGIGKILYIREQRGVPGAGVWLPKDSGVDTITGIADYALEDLLHADGEVMPW